MYTVEVVGEGGVGCTPLRWRDRLYTVELVVEGGIRCTGSRWWG